MNDMRKPSTNPTEQKTEIAKRLRAIGALADRLEHGAEARYVLDLAKAILASGDQIQPETGPT